MTAADDPAIVAKRADRPPIDTTEIRNLVEAAGYTVAEILTQVRPEDPGTHLGQGKVQELLAAVETHDAELVVIDGEVRPGQARNLMLELPSGVTLFDRYRLVLDIFAEQASDRRAAAQVELARLEYVLDWYEAAAEESILTQMSEKGSRRYQLEDRITALEQELSALADPTARLAERREASGLDLVTLAGYTNAGKSTLLRQLADDMSLETGETHPDRHTSAAVEDRLFKTLETTTRRATIRGRPILCTDTVGYISQLPHELVVSFGETLSAAGVADVVVLVTDVSLPPERYRRHLDVARSVLDAQGVDFADVIPVLNKIDAVTSSVVSDRRDDVTTVLPEPIAISATEGTNLPTLEDAIIEALPTTATQLELPATDAAMSVVSAAYDRATVHDVRYGNERVAVDLEGRPAVIESLRREAESVASQ